MSGCPVKITLIHNPGAGGMGKPDGEQLRELVRNAGHEVAYQSVKADQWQKVLDQPADFVAVAGGDGAVGKVARKLVGRGIPIAILPIGTANNVATTLSLTDTPLEQLIAGWPTGRRKKFDAGTASSPWGQRTFIEALGVGLFGRVLAELDANDTAGRIDNSKQRLTRAQSAMRDWLLRHSAGDVNAELDGQDISGAYLLLEAMNINHVGPNLQLAPQADPTDGLLDVVLVRNSDRDKLDQYLLDCLEDKPMTAGFAVRKGKHLRIEGQELPMHVDDDLWPSSRANHGAKPFVVEARVDQRALEFLIP